MYYDQYGNPENPIIVFLHGAYFVHAFGRQYPLADRYCLLVPHLPGYGKEVGRTFQAEDVLTELADWIAGLGKKVTLIGMSIGAQLAVQLVTDHEELFERAIFISPWLIKDPQSLEEIYEQNVKQLKSMRKRWLCHLIGWMNGLPKRERKEFVDQMQEVSEETVKNGIDNGICLETLEDFSKVTLPMVALAGEKEPQVMKDSVQALERLNPHCKAEIWEKAGHNIPPLFAKRLNPLICNFMEEERK